MSPRGCFLRGPASPKWKGGRTISDGYVYVNGTVFGSARANTREHVVVAERALGKPLPHGAIVHHFNNDGTDNRNRNLVIGQDQKYHMLLHALDRVRRAGGRPFLDRICPSCTVKPRQEFSPGASKCKSCAATWQRDRRKRRAA